MSEFKKIELKTFDSKGYKLTPIEFKDVVPFEVKRAYYILGEVHGAETGQHCHKVEEEVFIQLRGSSIAIIDRGEGKEEMPMSGPNDAAYVPSFVWHGFKELSSDCVILAFSSTNFSPDRSDYVEDYDEFKKITLKI